MSWPTSSIFPLKKLDRACSELQHLLPRNKAPLRDIQACLGRFNFRVLRCPLGVPFPRLYDQCRDVRRRHHRVSITRDAASICKPGLGSSLILIAAPFCPCGDGITSPRCCWSLTLQDRLDDRIALSVTDLLRLCAALDFLPVGPIVRAAFRAAFSLAFSSCFDQVK